VVAPFSKGVIAMGQRDFHPMSANFLLSKYLKSHWTNYEQGKRNVGQVADIADWRIARTIFVADDEATARRYAIESPDSPYRYYWNLLLKKMMLSKRHAIFKESEAQDDSALTIEYMLDKLVLWGTPERVADRILALREEAGPFGEIVYANMDWVDERLARRSIELMATEVMPRVNAAITGSAITAKAA
jgi:alkanesulfonate monooxygenase SsuD/methylene tetrahydromethanopterin reductase-like flavin-dependent oxidoreductase (luciferase family)